MPASEPRLLKVEWPLPSPASLIGFDSKQLPQEHVEVLVLGSGIAGLSAAVAAAERKSVLVLTKDAIHESNTNYAQGGIALALQGPDALETHIQDTIATGKGLADESVVRTVIGEGAQRFQELVAAGAEFDRKGGEYDVTREGGHSAPRVLHAGGDATGREIQRALSMAAFNHEHVRLYEKAFAVQLLVSDPQNDPDGPRCVGALVRINHEMKIFWAETTILATGGTGRMWRETTNPAIATGDGMAMAWRAGATLRDMEFMQFHPTTLYVAGGARILITEAVRGEGGILRNAEGVRFMPDYHERAELAPRDVVSRAIIDQMRQFDATNVWLDVTHFESGLFERRFPTIYQQCRLVGIDPGAEWIPVRPTAHYMIGGVRVDIDGQTDVPGLLACGEVSCTGLHGANRLGSNSLLEGLVLGHRAGMIAANRTGGSPQGLRVTMEGPGERSSLDPDDISNALKALMWRKMGVWRTEEGLIEAQWRMARWHRYILKAEFESPHGWQVQNQLMLAVPMLDAALGRQESRGVHFRGDYQETSARFAHHTDLRRESPKNG